MRKYLLWFTLLFVFLVPLAAVRAQQAEPDTPPLAIYSAGMFDADGSVLYSVYLTSAVGAENLTVSATVPSEGTFVEVFWTPENAVFDAEANGILTWTLPAAAPDSVVGPLSFRVQFPEDAEIPYHADARVVWDGGEVAAEDIYDLTLTPFAASGSLTVDAAGTDGAQPIGETGVWVIVPENAVSPETTITVTRLPADGAIVPPVDAAAWWCAVYQIEIESTAAPTQPISFALPTRKPTTPLLPASLFQLGADGEWLEVSALALPTTVGTQQPEGAYIGLNGDYVIVQSAELFRAGEPLVLAAGVDSALRIQSSTSWVDPEPEPIRGSRISTSGRTNTPGWVDPEPEPVTGG